MPRAPFVSQVIQDVRFGARMLLRRPGATAVIVLSLALGIGANTVVFSLVNALFLRSLPYPDSDRLVAVWFTPPNNPGGRAPSSPGSCLDIPEVSKDVFAQVGCYLPVSGNVSDPARPQAAPEYLNGETLSQSVTQVIGVAPALGRWFTPEEDAPGAGRVILISNGFWQRHFNGTRDVLGKTLRVADFSGDDSPSTIIGVMPDGFSIDGGGNTTDYFIPLRNSGRGRRSPVRNRLVIARLVPGVTVAQAQAAMTNAAPKLAELAPVNKGWGVAVMPLIESRVNGLRSPIGILQGVAALVLLIACANVGGLLLAQGMSRQREVAVRTAVGSARARIVRQLLTESLLLALIGTGVSLLVLWRGMPIVTAWLGGLTGVGRVGLDGRLLLFTIVMSLVTAVLFGTLPALQASRTDLATAFKDADRSVTSAPSKLWLRSTFVVAQIAMAVVLLTGAGLLVNTVIRLSRIDDAGFNPKGLTTFQMNFTGQEFFHQTGNVTPSGSLEFTLTERIDDVARDIRERLRAIPGVERVTSEANGLPLGGARSYNFSIAGRGPSSDRDGLQALWRPVAPEYFRTLEAPVLQGREFTETDRRGALPVALINAAMARKFWAGDNPIGQYISVQFFNDVPRQIVGIVGDIRQNRRAETVEPQMYVPYAQLPILQEGRTAFGLESVNFVVRSRLPLAEWLPRATAATVAADPLHAMSNVLSMEQFVASQSTLLRQYVTLLSVFSAIALLLAVIGVYGVMSQSVAQRTPEIGIRVAFGAQASDVLRLVLRQGVLVVLFGVVVGASAAVGATRVLQGLLWGVTPRDPATFATVIATIGVVASVACLVPAWRALKVDPLTAIRSE